MPGQKSAGESILAIDPDNLTPGMKQYLEVKQSHPDCLVMLRMGDFYEMFYQDAETAAKELEITLTARGKGEKRAPLAGVPYHALDSYLAKLVKKGYKVAIVEQLEDPRLAKGLVKRGVVRIVTPGTVIEPSMLEEQESNYCLALISALTLSGEEYAYACCELSTGEFFTSNVAGKEAMLSELARIAPKEVIIPESLKVNQELLTLFRERGYFINTLEEHYFREEKAAPILRQQFTHLQGLESFSRNIAVSGALLHYLQHTQKNALPHITSVSFRSREHLLLDAVTLRNLELLKNMRDGSSRGTLLSVLDKTLTPMGSRLIRRWLKEPLFQEEKIQQRLDAVEELHRNFLLREEIREILKNISDLERLIGRVNYGNATPKDLLALRHSLLQSPALSEKMGGCRSALLQQLSALPQFDGLAVQLDAVADDAPAIIREGSIFKNNYSAELDELRDIRKNSRLCLQQLEEREKKRTGISTLKVGYTNVFGYFLEVSRKNIPLVPADYIRKQTTANTERYVTEELKVQEEKILTAEEKSIAMEEQLFRELLQSAAEKTREIQETAQKVAALDVLCSFAAAASEYNYCKPLLVPQKLIELKRARHPVIERMQETFIPNDIFLQEGEMMLITGPNMSGKSSIMRQAALIVLMAQLGSFVPAEKATLGTVDRIFTRVGASDDISGGQSTFMVEMVETASILHQATKDSLIILDEIGRGTSTFDGVSLAWSVAEHIHNTIAARTMFSTHYHVLNKLAAKFPRMKNYNLAVREDAGMVLFLYTLQEGGTDQSYGIHVAGLAGLPSPVVQRAREIQRLLEEDDEMVRKLKAKALPGEQRTLGGW